MSDDGITIQFPLEFPVFGTPVSFQSSNPNNKNRWKLEVVDAAREVVSKGRWLSEEPISLTIYDFPTENPQGDVDNIIKLIQDALNGVVFQDDQQVRRIVAQRFLPNDTEELEEPPELVARALVHDPPVVYIRITNNPLGEAE